MYTLSKQNFKKEQTKLALDTSQNIAAEDKR